MITKTFFNNALLNTLWPIHSRAAPHAKVTALINLSSALYAKLHLWQQALSAKMAEQRSLDGITAATGTGTFFSEQIRPFFCDP